VKKITSSTKADLYKIMYCTAVKEGPSHGNSLQANMHRKLVQTGQEVFEICNHEQKDRHSYCNTSLLYHEQNHKFMTLVSSGCLCGSVLKHTQCKLWWIGRQLQLPIWSGNLSGPIICNF